MKEIKRQLNTPICLALGYFDCVHLVHRKIIGSAVNYAKENGMQSAVFTFYDDGISLIKRNLIRLYEERLELLDKLGVDFVLPFLFDNKCRTMSKTEFLEKLLSLCNVKAIFCGYDYAFGHKGEGNVEYLKEFCAHNNIQLHITNKVALGDEKISSTMIKGLLLDGKIESANELLISPYYIKGQVVRGRGEGRLFGIPTANTHIDTNKLLPKFGVYGTKTTIDDKTFVSVTNVGGKPTFGIEEISVETMIKDYDGDLYGKTIKVEFFRHIRDIKKFDSPYELQNQIYSDIQWEKNND